MAMMLTFNRQTLPLATDFLIAGTRGLLCTNSADVLQAAAQWRPHQQLGGLAAFEMEVLVDAAMDHSADHAAFFRGLGHLVFGMLPPRCFVTFDLLRRRVHAVLSLAAARDSFFWNNLLLPVTIGILGTTVGIVPLHCACLDHQSSGLLIAGDSGAGKSTLSAALAECGFAVVSDDWTYISKKGPALVAHGLSAPFKLLPDTVRFFDQLRNLVPRTTLNGELAYEIDPAQALGFAVKDISYPRRIFFLERTSKAGCYFVPCRSQYVDDFFERRVERLPNELPEARAFRASILRKLSSCPSWILRTGESPQRTAEAISDFVLESCDATT